MGEDYVERRAEAFAEVVLELLLAKDVRDAERVTRDDEARAIAKAEAYWVIGSLDDPSGDLGLWHVEQQLAGLKKAIKCLRQAEEALNGLAAPVKAAVSRNTKIARGLVIPSSAENALSARGVRLEQLPGDAFPLPSDATPHGQEDQLVQDAADPSKEITVYIGTTAQTGPTLIKQVRKALNDAKAKIDRVISQTRTRSTSQRRGSSTRGMRLDHRSWSAIRAYLEFRELWQKYRGRSPARYPKENDPFYEFAERGLEALEIKGIGDREHASVRSVIERLGNLEQQGIDLTRS